MTTQSPSRAQIVRALQHAQSILSDDTYWGANQAQDKLALCYVSGTLLQWAVDALETPAETVDLASAIQAVGRARQSLKLSTGQGSSGYDCVAKQLDIALKALGAVTTPAETVGAVELTVDELSRRTKLLGDEFAAFAPHVSHGLRGNWHTLTERFFDVDDAVAHLEMLHPAEPVKPTAEPWDGRIDQFAGFRGEAARGALDYYNRTGKLPTRSGGQV